MKANDLIEKAVGLPTGRPLPPSEPFLAMSQLAGIEIAVCSTISENGLRKAWRDRQGGGATPLLVVADDPHNQGALLAIGVIDANGPLRSVEAAALADVLERVSSKPRLEATRELSAELERLDQAGVPGLKVRDLLTMHTLDVRVRRDSSRWEAMREATVNLERGSDWKTILTGLGYQIEQLKLRGHLLRYNDRPAGIVHAKADPSEFSRLDAESRPPEGILINDAIREGAPFGILAAGGRLRLFKVETEEGNAVARYLDLDAASLQKDDFPFLGLLSPSYLVDGGFAQLEVESRSFGTALRKRLDETIRQNVLSVLGSALGRWARQNDLDVEDDEVRRDLEHAALTFLFRALFLLYAESAGHLPMDNRSYVNSSLTALVSEADESRNILSAKSTSLWDRYRLLVQAMRDGNPAWSVPAYNGSLFAAESFLGAATLEAVRLSDTEFAPVLVGLGLDEETGAGTDYSTLEIGHLGHIYEGLLSLRLSVATRPLRYDRKKDIYLPTEPDDAEYVAGDLLWQTHEGGRKAGGVYYTRSELVRHLVRRTVVPAFQAHLDGVRGMAKSDPKLAAEKLFEFSVLDPACGSAHFLVTVVAELSDLTVRFLADTPLQDVTRMLDRLRAGASAGVAIDDVALIRRLVMKRCVYGVDLSAMGAEIAKVSLWLASFVPGLSLAYLDRNIIVGNSLIGVASPEVIRPPGHENQTWTLESALHDAIKVASEAVARVAESEDRTPEEIKTSEEADQEARVATRRLAAVFDLWTAGGFELAGARQEVELYGSAILEGSRDGDIIKQASALSERHYFLHWPIAFPAMFSDGRDGFDVVVGNPPWEEVTIEELAFYARFLPGMRGMPASTREDALSELLAERPELKDAYVNVVAETKEHRDYYPASGDYESIPGDPDLYKFFCQRYAVLLRDGGLLGVVLPRSAFSTLGSEGFRRWLFEKNTAERIDFLLNNKLWMFDTHPQYTVALLAARKEVPGDGRVVEIAGTAKSLDQWLAQSAAEGIRLDATAFGPGWTTPLLRSQAEADLLGKLRQGSLFPFGSAGQWCCFPVRELDETNDRKLWEGAEEGWPLWKGESFDQFEPHGTEARVCPPGESTMKKARKPRPGSGSLLSVRVSLSDRKKTVLDELGNARVAFRDVSRSTDSRTARAAFIPPEVLLLNSAPYLAFPTGGQVGRMACLAIMNSLPFDWQARRFVENHLNFFILEGLVVPDLNDGSFKSIAEAAARLSCVDERFSEFAASFGIEPGLVDEVEREKLRIEIDAQVAQAWELTPEDLALMFEDFTEDAVSTNYRRALVERIKELP